MSDVLAENSQLQDDGCILWTGGTTGGHSGNRYAEIQDDEGNFQYAHRIAYELANGPIPKTKAPDGTRWEINHTCHTRQCVNPEHLELLSQRQHAQLHARERRHNKVVANLPLWAFALDEEVFDWAVENRQF